MNPTVRTGLGRSVSTRTRKTILAATLLLGLATALLLGFSGEEMENSFVELSAAAQSVMSILVAFVGVLLAADLRRDDPGRRGLCTTLMTATVFAASVGIFGIAVCGFATAVAGVGSQPRPLGTTTVAVGGLLVQIVAALTGTGLGLLLRPAVVACAATIVLPLGPFLLLAPVPALRAWLTPFGPAENLLAGTMSPLRWLQWLVAALLWPGVLNAVGARRLRRSEPAPAVE